jgi:hypothetical protein
MAANTAPNVNGSDPSILRQIQRQTDTALVKPASNPTVVGGTTTPTVTSSGIRAVAPVVSGEDVIFPQSTTTTSSNSVTINSSVNNDTGDITTVYTTAGRITVNPINQVINQYTSIDSGVSQILAGTGVTITSTGASGTGVVTINATGGGGNGDYGNSNVAAYLPTYTGNIGAGNVNLSGNIIGSSTIEIDNRASGNSADINLYSADDITLQARDRATGSTSEGGDINIFAGDSAEDSDTSGGDVIIEAGNGGASNIDFGGSGGFIRIEAGDGGAASANYEALSGGSLTFSAGDAGGNGGNIALGASGGDVTINAGDSTGNGDSGGEIILNTGLAGANALAGRVQINIPSSANGNGGTWTFDGTGNLTLPDNTFAVNYANGTQVPLGAAQLGNVTFDDVTVQGDNELNLSAGPDYTANLAYLQVRAGDVASHIHFDTGNSEAYDLIVGNDDKFVQVSSTGNIIMSSYDGNTSYTWTLDTTGNLILAGGNSVIQSIANSSSEPLYPNVSTMVFTPDALLSSQSLVLDPTGPSHIHLRAPGANIDEPDANIFLGGEASSFEVGYYNGNVPNLYIHSNNNTWTFDTAGTLVFPRDTGPNTTDPILNIIGGANPTITSTDASLAGPANLGISALNTIFTGFTGDAIKIYPDDGEISSTANLQIWANSGGNTEYSWTFGNDGVLTLPQGSQISETANTSVNITANTNTWAFGVDGNLTLPGDLVAISASPAPVIRGFSSVSALQFTNGNSNVTINANSNTWTFDSTGNLIIPGSSGGFIKTVANASIGIAAVDNGTNNPAQLLSMTNAGAATSIVSAYATNATIQTNATGTINTWAFDSTGNLTLPGNAVAIKFANGSAAFGNIATINLNGNTSQVLLGNGAFAAIPSSSIIANGNSNVSIATANGNVTISAVGNTTMTVTGTGANVTGTLTSTGKIGYASGSTVTQTTNRSQGVTINSLAGTIITTSAVMVPNQVDAIVVNNNQVDPATDIVYAQVVSYHNGCYLVTPLPTSLVGNGFYLYLKNIDTFSTANEAVTIRFMVIKAPNA